MQAAAYEFPRILLPRTPLNKGIRKGRDARWPRSCGPSGSPLRASGELYPLTTLKDQLLVALRTESSANTFTVCLPKVSLLPGVNESLSVERS